jgi:hypothetical protein
MDDNFKNLEANPKTIREVSEEIFYHALEILPPLYGAKCFAMGECFSGESFFWFSQIKAKYYGILATQAEAESAFDNLRHRLTLNHCQNCNEYKGDLKPYGAIVACAKCRSKLTGAEMNRRQISFFDDQQPLINF